MSAKKKKKKKQRQHASRQTSNSRKKVVKRSPQIEKIRATSRIQEQPDDLKMSEVILEFAQPALQFAISEKHFRRIIMLAVFAWNCSMLPEQEREKESNELIRDKMPEEIVEVFEFLLERKSSHYSHINRTIADYEIIDVGDGYTVNVLSIIQ